MKRGKIETMDVEKTVEFLLEQQAVSAARMGELHTIVHEMALNQVALGKAQARFDANMQQIQGTMQDLQGNMQGLQEQQKQTDETVQQLGVRVERLVQALENRFGSNVAPPNFHCVPSGIQNLVPQRRSQNNCEQWPKQSHCSKIDRGVLSFRSQTRRSIRRNRLANTNHRNRR